jgi:hypothetical protein
VRRQIVCSWRSGSSPAEFGMTVTFRTHSISPGDHRSSRGSGPAVPDEVLATTGLGGSARQMSASVFHPSSGRPDCVAGHTRLELRNVAAKYPFERPHGFVWIQPNSGHRDYSRLSCGAGEMPLGPRAVGIFSKRYVPKLAIERHRCKARIGRDFCRSKDAPPVATPATPLLTLRWTLSANRACVVITDTEPDRLAPLAPPAPMGLRGVWVVAARCCAGTIERSVVCPSANRRARRGLHPRWV